MFWGLLAISLLAVCDDRIPPVDSRNTITNGVRTHISLREYASRRDWEKRKGQLRTQVLTAAGLWPILPKSPLRPRLIRTVERLDVTVETILFEPIPGYFTGANIYRPKAGARKRAAVLIPHGHWKKGRAEDIPSYSVPALALNLAHQGYVAMTYDMVGYNDARQFPHHFGGWREQLWSLTPMGLQLWTSIRALDYLLSRPDVDGQRIGVTGASGGGTQTFLLAAVDERVRVAAPVNMVSAHMQGGDPCEEAPGLHVETNNVEFAAMMAPRPMLLISCTKDWTKNTPKVEFPAIQRIYELFGVHSLIENVHMDAEHNYNRDSRVAVYQFFAKYLRRRGTSRDMVHDLAFTPFRDNELLAAIQPEGAIELSDLFEWWKNVSRSQFEQTKDVRDLRSRLRNAAGVELPGRVSAGERDGQTYLTPQGAKERIPAKWHPGKGRPILLIHASGSNAAWATKEGARALNSGRPVLAIDVFQSGLAVAPHAADERYSLSYRRSVDANRVQDILTALSFLKATGQGRVELIGMDRAGIWCLFAAAVSGEDVELAADLDGFAGTDEDFHERFFVPGIQRAGGLGAALRLAGRFQTVAGRADSRESAE